MLEKNILGKTCLELTQFGLGATGIAGMYTEVPRLQAMAALEMAWTKGVRYFDVAPFYGFGLGERRMGDFLRDQPRDRFVISTKVGRLLRPCNPPPITERFYRTTMPFDLEFDYSYDGAMRSVEDSLQRLGLNRIDIALIHDIDTLAHGKTAQPIAFQQAMKGAYKALEQLRSEGVISAIGLGVNEWEVCSDALDHGDFDCFLLAGRFTLLEQIPLHTLLPKCLERSVSLIIGGVFNTGLLANPFAENVMYDYGPASADKIAKAKEIATVCKSFEIPLGAAALQYPLRHPAVATVISGARSGKEVSEIIQWMDMEIPAALWDKLTELNLTA
ncbi:MAG: aldo/keto reductase [Candidatus Parabeggiatoa sp. nov. 3]|jgi:D-threo-aldose 1-dehydrogenase|nr:MAG: aldo/keto reductase [Gammaproteobacteria bacterium]RKZ69501.1 MAG: aldo/keto reductase [Gammaproteobacteria bacterium]RKZ90115.1 MAG: aldo/keto reductase [Gammaproteobacteria bacterium]